MIGILLFGTESSKFQGEEQNSRGGLAYPHCYLLADLDIPSAGDVKVLKAMVEDEEESQKLLVPSKEPVSMANVLFCANQIFTTKAPNFSSRRLFIVTDNDNPHVQDKALRSAAAVRAKDLYDLGVIIELFPISKPDHEFDRSKFYDVCYNIYLKKVVSLHSRISSTGHHQPIQTHLLPQLQPQRHHPQETVSPC